MAAAMRKQDEAGGGAAPVSNGIPPDSRYYHTIHTELLTLFIQTLVPGTLTNTMNVSGRSTPVPEDAPPSIQSISSARKQVRARNRLFYTIDYVPRVSHFDPQSDYHNFRGFFTLFWIGLVIMVVTTVLRNIKDTGYPLRVQVWSILTANVWEMGFSDLAMVVSTALVVPMHWLFRRSTGWLRWARGGMVIMSLYEAGWLFLWIK